MVILLRSNNFKKRVKTYSNKIKDKIEDRLYIFIQNEYDSILNNHPLHGEYNGCRSVNITGNIRLVYRKVDEDTCILLNIGTHSQLYE